MNIEVIKHFFLEPAAHIVRLAEIPLLYIYIYFLFYETIAIYCFLSMKSHKLRKGGGFFIHFFYKRIVIYYFLSIESHKLIKGVTFFRIFFSHPTPPSPIVTGDTGLENLELWAGGGGG